MKPGDRVRTGPGESAWGTVTAVRPVRFRSPEQALANQYNEAVYVQWPTSEDIEAHREARDDSKGKVER